MSYQTLSAKAYALENGERAIVITQSRKRKNPAQTDAFDNYREQWLEDTVEIAQIMPNDFFFGELKVKCGVPPGNSSWWGAVGDKLRSLGFVRHEGTYNRTEAGNKNYLWSKPCKS